MFPRSVIRRVSFILIAQKLGYALEEIRQLLNTLPDKRTPNKEDWAKLSEIFNAHIARRISELTALQSSLEGCIGCGCLSLDKCNLYNKNDNIAENGAGARFLLGDSPK